jgi:hypothetical protein
MSPKDILPEIDVFVPETGPHECHYIAYHTTQKKYNSIAIQKVHKVSCFPKQVCS